MPHLPGLDPTLGGRETGKIPNARKPKTRPPRGFRDKVIFPGRALPTYTGPYPVGTMEIEVPVQHPRTFSHITRKGRHVLQLETVLMTVYYPAALEVRNLSRKDDRFSRELWLGRPRFSIAEGYGHFAGLPTLVADAIFLPAMFTKLPAYRNAPLAEHWAPAVEVKSAEEGVEIKTENGGRPEGASEMPRFPLMIFSHGLGGTRTMYSSLCGEFASYGFIVCAVEHRDGSGPRTFVNHAKEDASSRAEREKTGHVDHKIDEKERDFNIQDYIFPKGNPYDTGPNNPKGVDRALRDGQIDLRIAELEEAHSVMQTICNGDGQAIADKNLRSKGHQASSSHGLKGVNWSAWKGRFDVNSVTACGHSFGAATVVEMLRHDERFHYLSQGIIYDIWGAGIRPPVGEDSRHKIHAPILAINSEAFTYWKSNFDLVHSVVSEAQGDPHPSPSWLLTVRGTVHISQSDFSLLYPIVCSLFLKMVANPRRALDININASLEFLSHVLPAELAQVNRAYKNERFLENEPSPLDRIPSSQLHRPKDKYTAARLQIPHEWLFRTSPKLFRKVKRAEAKRKGRRYETGDEIWLHVKPTVEGIDTHLRSHSARSHAKTQQFQGAIPVGWGGIRRDRNAEKVSQLEGHASKLNGKSKGEQSVSGTGPKSYTDSLREPRKVVRN